MHALKSKQSYINRTFESTRHTAAKQGQNLVQNSKSTTEIIKQHNPDNNFI